MSRLLTIAVMTVFLLTARSLSASAKGDGIALSMEGGVSHVKPEGKLIRLVFKGRFYFVQYAGSAKSSASVDCENGCPAALTQANPFFAMTKDGAGGAIQEAGGLLRIL